MGYLSKKVQSPTILLNRALKSSKARSTTMNTRLLSTAVAIVDRQTNPDYDSDDVKLRKIWRWLEAIQESEPPEEQAAFNNSGEPIHPALNQTYRSVVFKDVQEQLQVEQAKREQELLEDIRRSSLAPKPPPSYGRVQILKRSPTPPFAGVEMEDPIGIQRTGKSVSQWVRRIRADSKTATQKLFKHTK